MAFTEKSAGPLRKCWLKQLFYNEKQVSSLDKIGSEDLIHITTQVVPTIDFKAPHD